MRFLLLCLCLLLTACSPSLAQVRQFLPLNIEFLGAIQLPSLEFAGTRVGGLSGLTYDRTTGRFYALSDDRSQQAPARFYTLRLDPPESGQELPSGIAIEAVTLLKDAQGQPFPPGSLDPEDIALTPRHTVMISSEGDINQGIAPWIGEFDLTTGQAVSNVRIPARFLPATPIRDPDPPHGIRNNLGFEALAVQWTGLSDQDPFRLFTAPESYLSQDQRRTTEDLQERIRLLHYVINPIGDPVLVSENLYLLEPPLPGTVAHGLSAIATLDTEGYFLSLERSLGLSGYTTKLFQIVAGNATDTSRIATLGGELTTVQPLQKQLLLDFTTLGIPLDNLEGMTLGPQLADGSQMLVVVSDDNFREEQVTQCLFFRLTKTQPFSP
ncbi:esterase-like activity of phytase family protein [Spirulina sp. CCNP1310]|uniref:esterase-like activity of phytase family protein n=1 Tax=Spirulina sp. CCNP1310 TaxID=3110249 RepID=UPI002B1ECB09|nr:esterase-like activity of phytase family protein [Spirulina sp. CCNP1310]MEA5420706.1 esterase-like activity of phytase family protein [Spirulina sp. CCNP1310]